jgi:hypothetical protein
MSTTVSAQRARTAALIAAALAALGCSESAPLTAPAHSTRAASIRSLQTPALPSTMNVQGPVHSGYALASGRFSDSLAVPTGK